MSLFQAAKYFLRKHCDLDAAATSYMRMRVRIVCNWMRPMPLPQPPPRLVMLADPHRAPGDRRRRAWASALIAALPMLLIAFAVQAQTPAVSVTIRNHQFVPTQVEVPANQKVELHIINGDPTPAEFESTDLRREKVVAGGQEITVYIGPLRPGSYEFYDDFNPSARGHVVAR